MKMQEKQDLLHLDLRRLELWLLAGWFAWIAVLYTLESPGGGWLLYTMIFALVALSQSPVWVFLAGRARWLDGLSPGRRILWWLMIFSVLLWLPALIMEHIRIPGILHGCFVVAASGTLVLELVVQAHAYFRRSGGGSGWFRKISLDRAILFTIGLIAVTLAAMAVSSMDDPQYRPSGFLLIGFEFSFSALFRHWWTFLSLALQFCIMYAGGYLFFYINSRVLVAQVLKPYGVVLYAGAVLAVAALLYPVIAQLLLWLPVNDMLGGVFHSNPFKLENAFAAIMIMLISLPVVVAIQWGGRTTRLPRWKRKGAGRAGPAEATAESSFFFNTLNNLYALSLTQSGKTPESILQLSELMRYVIYRGKEAEVALEEEVQYLDNYIALETIRLKRQADIRFEKDIREKGRQLAPLLLAGLVENAFKHGVTPSEGGAMLHISLYCDEAQLRFRCENTFVPDAAGLPGIGLSNLRRRLGLLYPGRHTLQTTAKIIHLLRNY